MIVQQMFGGFSTRLVKLVKILVKYENKFMASVSWLF